jgi:hypothetical protein
MIDYRVFDQMITLNGCKFYKDLNIKLLDMLSSISLMKPDLFRLIVDTHSVMVELLTIME